MNPSTGDLGSIQVGIALDIANLQKQMAQVVGEFKAFGQKIDDSVTKTQASILRQYTTAVERQNRLAQQQADRQIREQRRAAQEIEREQKRHAAAMLRMNSMIGGAAGRAGIIGAAGLGDAAKTAAEFDQSMRNVDSIAHLTEQQLASLRKEVLKLTSDRSIRQTPDDLAKGLYQVYSAGKSGKEGLEILQWGAKGASAGMTDAATSTKVLLAVLNSGISGVNNAREAMDVLFQEVNLGVNTFPELANSIGNVLPTAKVVGVSLQEVAAAMAQMTRNGINTDKSVTALNQLLNHIWKPGKEAEKLMTSLGISFGSAALEAKGLGGWLKDVLEKTHGNRDQLAHLIPEVRGAKGEFSLLSDGLKGYNELLKGMQTAGDGAGQTTEALTRQNKGAVAQFELLKKEVDLTKIAIGDALLPTVNDAMKRFREWLEEWNKQPEAAKNAQTAIALFTAEIGLGAGAISTLIGWLAKLKTAMTTLGIGIGAGSAAAGVVGASVAGAASMAKTFYDGAIQEKIDAKQRFAESGGGKANRSALESERKRIEQGLKDYAGIPAKIQELQKRKAEVGAALASLDIAGAAADDARKGHITDTKPKSPWGAGGYDRNAGKGGGGARDAAREREQAIKDAIREAQDERALLARLIAERKQLGLTGYELARFNAQQQFDATMRDAKTPASRAQAALLYQDQVRQAKRERDAAAREKWGYNDFEDRMQEAVDQAEAKRQRGLSLLTQGMGNAYASQQYANQMAEAVAKEIEEQKRAQDEIMEYRRRTGEITNADYIKFLQERVQAERTFGFGGKETSEQNPEFRAKNLELRQHYSDALESIFGAKGRKGGAEGAKEIAEGMSQGNKYIRQAMEDIGGGALGTLQKALRHGMKGTFGEILAKTLTDLLSTAIENAIASAFSKKKKSSPLDIFGGGGLLGSFLSPIESLFGGGRAVQAVSPAAASRGVSVHIHGDNHFHNGMDVQEFGRTIAWQVQNDLNRSLSGGLR